MAATVDTTNSPARFSGAIGGGLSITSASFTNQASCLVVLAVQCDGSTDVDFGAGAVIPYAVSNTGGTLTWVKQVERTWSETTAGGESALWTAIASVSAARTVSITKDAGSSSTRRVSARVYLVQGADVTGTPVDAVGASNEGGSATNDLTISSVTPGANGLLMVSDCDWNQLGVMTSSDLTLDSADYSGAISVASGYKACSSGVGVTADLNAGGTAAAQHKWCQIVVRAAAAADVLMGQACL